MKNSFSGIYEGQTVLVTGHTGFKGSWLSLWLQQLGAKTIGYSLPSPTEPSNFTCSAVAANMIDIIGDIRDYPKLLDVIKTHQPSIIFHLAAQPIVLQSFHDPKETFDVNVGGTVNVLEAARHCPSVKALVMITSDKCYDNKEWLWGYRENDAIGGPDPYSASKGMAEHAISSYRTSFFQSNSNKAAVASARAGNVIGGGDFSDSRIVPDCMKALMNQQPVVVRNPNSVRPWLNVLDPLSGYLWLGAQLLSKGHAFADSWNFGPLEHRAIDVQTLVEEAIKLWGEGDWIHTPVANAKPEMGLLRLNWDKAANQLDWHPTYTWKEALNQTVDWFKAFENYKKSPETVDMQKICIDHIKDYTNQAAEHNLKWASKHFILANAG